MQILNWGEASFKGRVEKVLEKLHRLHEMLGRATMLMNGETVLKNK